MADRLELLAPEIIENLRKGGIESLVLARTVRAVVIGLEAAAHIPSENRTAIGRGVAALAKTRRNVVALMAEMESNFLGRGSQAEKMGRAGVKRCYREILNREPRYMRIPGSDKTWSIYEILGDMIRETSSVTSNLASLFEMELDKNGVREILRSYKGDMGDLLRFLGDAYVGPMGPVGIGERHGRKKVSAETVRSICQAVEMAGDDNLTLSGAHVALSAAGQLHNMEVEFVLRATRARTEYRLDPGWELFGYLEHKHFTQNLKAAELSRALAKRIIEEWQDWPQAVLEHACKWQAESEPLRLKPIVALEGNLGLGG